MTDIKQKQSQHVADMIAEVKRRNQDDFHLLIDDMKDTFHLLPPEAQTQLIKFLSNLDKYNREKYIKK